MSARVDRGRLTGAATYTDDLRRPRMAHGKLVRSPHAHARIRGVDTAAARAVPGVLDVITGDDLPVRFGAIPVARDETALASGKVRYAGEPVACVLAIDEETAHRAGRLVHVDYEPLPAVLSIDDALAPGAPLVHDEGRKPTNVLRRVHQHHGDVDAALAGAAVVIEREFTYPGSTHVPLEPHAALAEVEPDGRLVVWASTQNPHYLHKDLARVLGVPEDRVRVVKPAVGAGYGGKCDPTAVELCAGFLALRHRRPVKVALEREEVFYQHRGRHPTKMWIRLGLRADGTIAGIDFKAWAAGGAYASYGVVTAYYLGVFLTLPYVVGDVRFETMRLYTNEPPCGPKRGHGAIQPRLAVECALDEAAIALGLDPAAVRIRNAVPDGHVTANGLVVGTSGLARCVEAVVAASGWRERRARLGPGRGLGLAASSYMCGALHPVHDDAMPQSAAIVKIDRSGEVTLLTGTADIGQGSVDALARMCAERLGIDVGLVRVVEGDTALTPVDLGSYSSRVTFMAGHAVIAAASTLEARLRGLSGTWVQRVRAAEEAGGPLVGIGSYTPPKVGSRFRRSSVGPSPAYSFTAQVAEVEVDRLTGIARVVKVWCAHDVGHAINAKSCEGQIEGCVYMGVGEALYEEQTYRHGLVRAPSILEYHIPTVHEVPEIVPILIETNEPLGPLGAKEVGEGPQLPTVPAIANAIAHAIGRRPTVAPFTPDRLLRLIEGKA